MPAMPEFLHRHHLAILEAFTSHLRFFWVVLAGDHGNDTLGAAESARSLDTSSHAAKHYRDLLAGMFMIRVLPPWFENVVKRLVNIARIKPRRKAASA